MRRLFLIDLLILWPATSLVAASEFTATFRAFPMSLLSLSAIASTGGALVIVFLLQFLLLKLLRRRAAPVGTNALLALPLVFFVVLGLWSALQPEPAPEETWGDCGLPPPPPGVHIMNSYRFGGLDRSVWFMVRAEPEI